MGVDLRMEPYAEKFEEDRPGLRILDEFCFPDIVLRHLLGTVEYSYPTRVARETKGDPSLGSSALPAPRLQPAIFTAGGFHVPSPGGRIDGGVVFGQ